MYVGLCSCSEASESSHSLLWKKKMHFWPKCVTYPHLDKTVEDWVSLSEEEIHESQRNSSSDRVHPGPDCTPGVYALILARSEAGKEILSFPALSVAPENSSLVSHSTSIKLVNSCKKECSLDCNKFFLSIFLWLGNRWQFIIEKTGYEHGKKA